MAAGIVSLIKEDIIKNFSDDCDSTDCEGSGPCDSCDTGGDCVCDAGDGTWT